MDDDELAKDETAIKLFGRTIPLLLLPETLLVEAAAAEAEETVFEESAADDDDVDDEIGSMERASPSDLIGNEAENDESAKDSLGATGTTTIDANTEADVNESTEPNQNSESPTIDDVTTTTTTTSSKDEEQEQDHDQDQNNKTLKKPDKILPCPRCNSMETKFCYYNNYNVNQPRHYCRRCQRYWTAGGIMRNVPIGAGRRKNKNLVVASQCTHHVAAHHHHHHGHLPNGTHSNHAVLNFGYDQGRLQEFPDTGKTLTKSKTDDPSNEEQSDNRMQYSHRVHPPPPPPPQAWPPYPWNPIQWNSSVSAVALTPSGFQLPFYPPPPPFFWGCSSSVPSVWNVPNPQTFLGKHSRDNNNDVNPENNPKECNPEKCFWVPKPLRIDELGEGARSSIWKTLGIKMEKKSDLVGEKNDFLKTSSSVLQANPAAFSRSLNFRENM